MNLLQKSVLGIDIGTSAIKIVELSKFMGKVKLENYLGIPTFPFQQKEVQIREKSVVFVPSEEIAQAIKFGLEKAKIKTKNCVFAIPDFLTFFTNFSLPPMDKEEIKSAVTIEARKHIPVPIKEVTLDWQIVEEGKPYPGRNLNVLLVAIPNEIIYKYQKIAILSNLKILAMEAEVFGLMKALIKKEMMLPTAIIDGGAKSTTCSIVERGFLKVYHSLNFSFWSIVERLTKELGIDWQLAEKIGKMWGLSEIALPLGQKEKEVWRSTFALALKPFLEEIERIFRSFYLKEKKEIDKIILAGGIGLIPGILQFFAQYFKKKVEMANPFSEIAFPLSLKENLEKMGPAFSVAIGVALRHLY